VDELFDSAHDRHLYLRICPVTGVSFTKDDRIILFKDRARRALAAAEWFAQTGPREYELPLSYQDREALKASFGEGYIIALFARSLAISDWHYNKHVIYPSYAAGILVIPDIGKRILQTDPSLACRYLPVQLPGLEPAGRYAPN
jgi:hypothetical protein